MSGLKIELDLETAEKITVALLENNLKWWSSKRGWNEEEKKFRREYVAAMREMLKWLK